jgi:hypothetical protein
MEGHDYNILPRSNGLEAPTWGWWWKPPSSPAREPTSATTRRKSNLNKNEQGMYQNEAEVMYITSVTMDHFQSSYLKRNMSLKIMVLDLKWHDLQN